MGLCLTQLAYMQHGLTERQVCDCLEAVFVLELSQQDKVFR